MQARQSQPEKTGHDFDGFKAVANQARQELYLVVCCIGGHGQVMTSRQRQAEIP